MLRVAMVATSLRLAGAEKQTYYMARALHQAGIDVRFYYLGAGGYYETRLRQAGVPIHQVCSPNRPWMTLVRLTGALCWWRPQIVLVTQFGDLLYAAAAARGCRALLLGGIRSDGLYELQGHRRWSRWMFRVVHGSVANSCRARQNLVERGILPQKIAVLPNVIELQDFDQRGALPVESNLPTDRVIAAAVGNLHPCKRFDRFLKALALARQSEPSLAGVIAGADYGAKAGLQSRASALGFASDDLIFLGEFDRVPALLRQAALLVLTSDYEGFPNVILEAMAARLPVVTVPAGDAHLIVQHGKTGFVVEADDTPGMAARLVQLAQSASLRADLGNTGRKRVEQRYSYELLADRLLAIFHRFANQQRRLPLCELLARGPLAKELATFSGSWLPEPPPA